MADKYQNYEELRAHERLGADFRIYMRDVDAPVAIIAPHGGGIERGTSELARVISGTDYNIYCFEGIKLNNNSHLHLTSTNFDEPQCLKLVAECTTWLRFMAALRARRRFSLAGATPCC